MKKLILSISLLLAFSAFVQAQSKLSYSALINQSASTNDVENICIFRISGGECLDLEKIWKTNITLNVNYEVNSRLRLQSGLGYNVLSMDQLNESLGTDKFKIKYLSIPMRAHYLINKGKVRFYTGIGIRTDIRLNGTIPVTESGSLRDNGRGIAMSMEGLIGLEIPVSPNFKIHFEPTYSKAITPYADKGYTSFNGNSNGLTVAPHGIADKYPSRIGISLGFTFNL